MSRASRRPLQFKSPVRGSRCATWVATNVDPMASCGCRIPPIFAGQIGNVGLNIMTMAGLGGFPPTRYSVLVAAGSADPSERFKAREAIAAAYWKPVYKYSRLKWGLSREQAEDFVQDFFLRLIEKDVLRTFDPAKGRLRTFLRTCADRMHLNQVRDRSRQRRSAALTLDLDEADQEIAKAGSPESLEEYFDKEWVRNLMSLALERFRIECISDNRECDFNIFTEYEIGDEGDRAPSYASLAMRNGLTVTDVTNRLARAKRGFRRCVLGQLRDITASEEEFRKEAKSLLGYDAT
jgi:RNA polymerase sigma factor (sigma-70 family)